MDSLSCVDIILEALKEKKGRNVIAFDLRGVSSITDYVVIAEGEVDRHVMALAESVKRSLRDKGERPSYTEGTENGEWIVLDYLNVIVHLLLPDLRALYHLESLWGKGKRMGASDQNESGKGV